MIIRCKVEVVEKGLAWEVTFPDAIPKKESLYLQSDWLQYNFAVACGAVPADRDPGCREFIDLDPQTIVECPDDCME